MEIDRIVGFADWPQTEVVGPADHHPIERLSRFYAEGLDLLSNNSSQINNLQTRSVNFFNPDPKGSTPMSLNKNIRSCTHIKVNGTRCGSPALRGEVFCYFHQRMIRGVRTPPKSRLHPIALIENEEASRPRS